MDRLLFRPAREADVAVTATPSEAAVPSVDPMRACDGASDGPHACEPALPSPGGIGLDESGPPPTLGALWVGVSLALDLAEGQPEGHALRSAWIALHIGQSLGLETAALRQLCETVLLKDLGGSCIAAALSALTGVDDRWLKPRLQQQRPTGPAGVLALLAREPRSARVAGAAGRAVGAAAGPAQGGGGAGGAGGAPGVMPGTAAATLARWWRCARHGARVLPELQRLRSRQGAELARQLSLSEGVAHAIGALDEHWDGQGGPQGLPGEAIALGARIALLAQQTERAFASGGPAAALALARRQSGRWFDPHLVQMLLLLGREPAFWEPLLDPQLDEQLLAHPAWQDGVVPDAALLDDIAATFGLVADAKSPGLQGHSERVSTLCDAMARRLGLPLPRRQALRRAAALHDLGKLGVSSLLLERAGRLSPPELARVRQHVRHTRRLLSRIPGFEPLARLCGDHHERLDGSGYPCGLSARQLPLDARLLGVADLYDALVSPRAHRPALAPAQALRQLRAQADAGQIDGRCIEVLARVVRAQGALDAVSSHEASPPAPRTRSAVDAAGRTGATGVTGVTGVTGRDARTPPVGTAVPG